jgi:hypothetical protein
VKSHYVPLVPNILTSMWDKLAAVEAGYKAMKLVVAWQRYTGGNVQI